MIDEKEKQSQKENLNENIQNNSNSNDVDLALSKKSRKEKKSFKKISSKNSQDQAKVIPLLKPPSKRRKFDKDGKAANQRNNCQTGIIWDNKTIEEQHLDRKLHRKVKIDEPKTSYPDGDKEDLYEEGMNKVNEIKATEELLKNVVDSLNINNKSKTGKLKVRTYSNDYANTFKFDKENNKKFEDLTGERKLCLQNTLINKFHKEVRSLSKGRTQDNY
jgi:hypothetical protein